jgi:hypothetical protein
MNILKRYFMKKIYRIVSAMCLIVLFTVNGALGSYISDLKNLTDSNETIEEDTPIERAIEAGNCDSCITEKNMGPVVLGESPIQAQIPVSATQSSPGIGIVGFFAVLSAIYIGEKKKMTKSQ